MTHRGVIVIEACMESQIKVVKVNVFLLRGVVILCGLRCRDRLLLEQLEVLGHLLGYQVQLRPHSALNLIREFFAYYSVAVCKSN